MPSVIESVVPAPVTPPIAPTTPTSPATGSTGSVKSEEPAGTGTTTQNNTGAITSQGEGTPAVITTTSGSVKTETVQEPSHTGGTLMTGSLSPAAAVSSGTTAVSSGMVSSGIAVSSSGSNAPENTDEEEQDDEDIDLGDNKAEMDSKKDFTAVVRQSKDYTCGPAALATLMTQLGNDTSEEEVLARIQNLSPEKGVSLSDLKQSAEKLEQKVYLKKWDADAVLAYVDRTSDPVLIHDEKKDVGGHFSVIKSFDREKGLVELSDTEAGNIKYSVEDFRHIYTGHALVISEDTADESLNNTGTNISDEEALTVWGKYVPVVMYAQNSGNDAYSGAVNTFRTCQNKALSYKTVAERNAARKVCYDKLGSAL